MHLFSSHLISLLSSLISYLIPHISYPNSSSTVFSHAIISSPSSSHLFFKNSGEDALLWGATTSQLQTQDFDFDVDPRDNLYLFANGGWLKHFDDKEIPRDFRKWYVNK
jgi:hypothetical protein